MIRVSSMDGLTACSVYVYVRMSSRVEPRRTIGATVTELGQWSDPHPLLISRTFPPRPHRTIAAIGTAHTTVHGLTDVNARQVF